MARPAWREQRQSERRAQQLIRAHHSNNPRVAGYALQRQAEVLHLLDRNEPATAACTDAIEQMKSISVPEHPVRSRCLLRMAQSQLQTGNRAAASALLDQAAPQLRATLIADAPSLQLLERLQAQIRPST